MKNVFHLGVGLAGTKATFVLADLQPVAAVAAGFATAAWMLTQTVLAILHRRKK